MPGREIGSVCEETFSFPFGLEETRDVAEVMTLLPVGKGVTVTSEPRGEVIENWQQIRNAGKKKSELVTPAKIVRTIVSYSWICFSASFCVIQKNKDSLQCNSRHLWSGVDNG